MSDAEISASDIYLQEGVIFEKGAGIINLIKIYAEKHHY